MEHDTGTCFRRKTRWMRWALAAGGCLVCAGPVYAFHLLLLPPIGGSIDLSAVVAAGGPARIDLFVSGDGAQTWHLLTPAQSVNPAQHTVTIPFPLPFQPGSRVFAAADADTDRDQDDLPDGRERFLHRTNPDHPDTDRDRLPDGWEVRHELDPLDDGSGDPRAGPAGDPDGDRLDNLEEVHLDLPPDRPNPVVDPSNLLQFHNVFPLP